MSIKYQAFRKRNLFLLALVVFSAHGLFAQTSLNDRTEIFEQVWATINEKYYDASFNGVDWLAVKRKYRARVNRARGEKDFYALLDRMAGELRDSHTRVYSPAERAARRDQKRASAGLTIKNVEGFPVIVGVERDSEAERAGIKPGMIVRRIGNRPFGRAIRAAAAAVGVSSSARATEMRIFSRVLTGEPGSVLTLELADERGRPRKFSVTRRIVSADPQVSSRILSSGVGYLKFDKFDEKLEKQLTESLEKLRDARALILDLRDNRGGDGEVGLRFAGHFLDDKVTVARIVTRTGKPPIPEIPMVLETGAKGTQLFSRPVVILVGEATASTAELIANALREQKRAVVFGTNSCGCVLAFLDYIPLKGGGDLSMSEFGFVTAGGAKLEGSGVKPDRKIDPTLTDVRKGRDAAVEQAELYLKNLLG